MINLSRIDDLLKLYCSNGVPFEKISNVYTRLKGTPITAAKMKEVANDTGDITIIAGGKTIVKAFEKDIPKCNTIKVPALLVQSRGLIDFVYIDSPFTFKNEMWAYTAKSPISVKYLYYVLKKDIDHFRNAASGMGSMPQISLSITEEHDIPYPPLPIQEEIVRILDTFTELTAELTAELTLRKKQYEFYRDKLLSFDGLNEEERERLGVRCVSLESVCSILDSKRMPISSEKRSKGEYPYYGANGVQDYVSDYIFDGTFLLIGEDGSVINQDKSPVLNWASGKIWVNNHAHVLEEQDDCKLRYLYYYLQTTDVSSVVRGVPPKLNQKSLREIKIELPSLNVQEKIVNQLDILYQYVSDLQTGLPAEISARQKQYEYYRDKLLSFKEVKA